MTNEKEITADFAIEYLLDDCEDCPENKDGECMTQSHCFEVKQMAIKALEKEPVKGHWIDHSDEGYVECSECGSCTNCDGNIADLHFCFNCGAEMDEDERTLNYADQNTMMSAT